MSSTDDRPTLLPGVSARTWQLVLQALVWIATAATAFAALGNIFFRRGAGLDFAYIVPVVVAYVLVYLTIFISGARGKKEVAAGYTTLPRSNPTVAQLDATTGELLRRPGEPYLKRGSRGSASAGDYDVPVVESKTRPSRWVALRSLWFLPIAAAVATFGMFARSGWLNPAGFVWLPVVFAGFLGLVFVILLAVGVGARRTLSQVRASAPGDLVFVFSRSKTLWPALNKAGWTLGEVPLATGLAASANAQGLSVWQAGPATKGLMVPWSSVVSVQTDSIVTGNQTRPGVLVTLTAPGGDLVALPFANSNPDSFPLVSKPGVAYLVAQLDQLRTGKTTARLI
jgi:hypothetical protein